MHIDKNYLTIKIAQSDQELRAAQRLRYRVFVEELGANTSEKCHRLQLEYDEFDESFEHLILVDEANKDVSENVIGVYRLLTGDVAYKEKGFYSAVEYDLQKLINSGRKILELGRSCVNIHHRGGVALYMMWNGLAEYVIKNKIDILFGVASFHGTDSNAITHALSFLHHNHLAPENLQVRALGKNRIEMDILPISEVNRMIALKQLPPLIKAYIRLGGFVGCGASLDNDFNTIDVCLVMDTQRMLDKYKSMYLKGAK